MLAGIGRFANHGGPPAERGSTVPLSPVGGQVGMKALKVLKQSESAI